MVSWNLSGEVEISNRIIYISLIFPDNILAKESKVSPQLLGSGWRVPPTVMLSVYGSHSVGPGHGVFFEALQGRGNSSHSSQANRTCSHQGRYFLPQPLRGRLPEWGQAQRGRAALTDGFTALVSVDEGHDGAQGHVWVIPKALQAADGILDVLCQERPRG